AHNISTVDLGANPGWGFGLPVNFTTGFHITLLATPVAGGNVTGDGDYPPGTVITVNAIAAPHYKFKNWTENGRRVSKTASYRFTVGSSRTLTAHFARSRR